MEHLKIYDIDGVLDDKQYNVEVADRVVEADKNQYDGNLNFFVMNHTFGKCRFDSALSSSVAYSVANQKIIFAQDKIDFAFNHSKTTDVTVSKKRSFEAASYFKDKKVAVLDFASATHPGGSPWHSRAQEESLCRCSTLQPCLYAAKPYYHDKHHNLGCWGTDDMMYIPKIVVFKSDERGPRMLKQEQWFNVDIIVSAAPHFGENSYIDEDAFNKVMTNRIERILQIAQKEEVQVLILGAFGCGAFNNPPTLVAKIFKELLQKYYFEKVEFAIDCSKGIKNFDTFKDVIENN